MATPRTTKSRRPFSPACVFVVVLLLFLSGAMISGLSLLFLSLLCARVLMSVKVYLCSWRQSTSLDIIPQELSTLHFEPESVTVLVLAE